MKMASNFNEESATPDAAVIKDMPNQEFDEAVTTMHYNIQKNIAENYPLVGDKEDINDLRNDYAEDDDVYLKKISLLSQKYSDVRKTRGDGNCFYRAFGFGYLEYLLTNKEKFTIFRTRAAETKKLLEKLGYPTFTVEDFHDQFMNVVDLVGSGATLTELIDVFRDDGQSNYLVVYLRLITSCHLQHNSEFFQHFVDGNRTVADFCKGEVEPMDRESDHIHIIAVANALELCIRVAYVDRGNSDNITYHDFPEGSAPQLHLLYRPGHYDIIYPR